MKTGAEYIESLRDGRRVYVGGELIDDVTIHPKTRGYAAAIAEYYDLHHRPEHQDVLTFVDADDERACIGSSPGPKRTLLGVEPFMSFGSGTTRVASLPVRRRACML